MSVIPKPQPSHEEIARRAHELWQQAGQPAVGGERHWLQAEAELKLGVITQATQPARRRARRPVAAL